MLARPQGDNGVAVETSSSSLKGLRPKRTTRFDFLLSSSSSSGPSKSKQNRPTSESSPLEPLSECPSVGSSRAIPSRHLSREDFAAFESIDSRPLPHWTKIQGERQLNLIARDDSIWRYNKDARSATSSSLSSVMRLRNAASRSRASSLAGPEVKSARSEGPRTPATLSAAPAHILSPRGEVFDVTQSRQFRSRLSHMMLSDGSRLAREPTTDTSIPSRDSTLVPRPAPTGSNASRLDSFISKDCGGKSRHLSFRDTSQAQSREKQVIWNSENEDSDGWKEKQLSRDGESPPVSLSRRSDRTRGSYMSDLQNGRSVVTDDTSSLRSQRQQGCQSTSYMRAQTRTAIPVRSQNTLSDHTDERGVRNVSAAGMPSGRRGTKGYSEESTLSHAPAGAVKAMQGHTAKESVSNESPRLQYQSSGQLLMRRLIEEMRHNVSNGAKVVRSLDKEMASKGFQGLIDFTHCHSDQVALWVEAFNHWDTFISSIVNSLAHSNSLRPEDGAQVLDVLPSPVLLYIYRRRYKSELLPVMPLEARQLCMIPHVAQMGLTLVSVLSAAHEYSKCQAMIQLISSSIHQLGDSRLIVDLFKSIRIFINSFPVNNLRDKSRNLSLQNSARLSLYTLIKFVHESASIERFLQSFIFTNPSVTAQVAHGKLSYVEECKLLFECQKTIDDEIEGVVTKTSLFLGGIGSCLAMHLTSLQALEESLDTEISRLKEIEQERLKMSGDFVFKSFDVRVPPFSAVPQLQFVSSLVQKLTSEYSLMQRQICQVIGRLLGINEFTQNSQGPQPPVSMLIETLTCFVSRIDECMQHLLLSLNISQSDLSHTTDALQASSRVCLPTIADFFGV